MSIIKKLFRNKKDLKQVEVQAEAAAKRAQIIHIGQCMKRLVENPDYQVLLDVLLEDKKGMTDNLLNEAIVLDDRDTIRTRLIARINQIDRIINKPKTLIWQMKNLTEVRAAIEEQGKALVGQAHGNQTGGEENGTK